MQVEINPKSATSALEKKFFEKTGVKLAHAEALELLATMCGFKEYRAMAAHKETREAVPAAPPFPLTTAMKMQDWLFVDEPQNEEVTELRKRPYTFVMEQYENCAQLTLKPEGSSNDELDGKAALSIYIEVNGGVPSIAFGNDVHEHLVTVFATPQGLYVRQDSGNWREQENAPSDTELERIVNSHGKYADGMVVLNDTALATA